MATTAVSGKGGSITIGTDVAEVTSWEATLTTAALDATSMDSAGFMEFIDGLQGGTGSFASLVFLNKQGEQAAATFRVATPEGANAPHISGKINITSQAVEVTVDGVVNYSYDFSFNEAITIDVTPGP